MIHSRSRSGGRRILPASFFSRPTDRVALELIGMFLVRRVRDREVAVMITETEAYDGFEDKASHASRGKTARNEVMFGRPGRWYVYLCYGVHEMLNVVTRENGYPAAVLIRGARHCSEKLSRDNFSEYSKIAKIINGPGRVTKFMRIGRSLNAQTLSLKTGLWIEDRGVRIQKNRIKKTPRVGVAYAGEYWTNKKCRFVFEP